MAHDSLEQPSPLRIVPSIASGNTGPATSLLDENLALRQRVEFLEAQLEAVAWSISPGMAQATIDRLQAQIDTFQNEEAVRNLIEDREYNSTIRDADGNEH